MAIDPEPQPTCMTQPVREPDLDGEPDVDFEAEMEDVPELDAPFAFEADPLLAGTDPGPTIAFEPVQTTEPVTVLFDEAGATVERDRRRGSGTAVDLR